MKNTAGMPELKKEAALAAAALVKSGWKVGLGTGSTTAFVIEELGRRQKEEGLEIDCVVTSFSSLLLAQKAGLLVHPLQSFERLDMSIDGADEIDPALNLIKGGGAAHTMEKLVHAMSDNFIVVADYTKNVSQLGDTFKVPVELIKDSIAYVESRLKKLGATEVVLRMAKAKDGPIVSDNGNFIMDAAFAVTRPVELESQISAIVGVVENGIFAAPEVKPTKAIIATENGIQEQTAQ